MSSTCTEASAKVGVPAPAEVTGVLLCGGASRRMGRDKARIELADRGLIEYPLAALREVAARVVLATGTRPRYAELGHEAVLDGLADGGPLAGLLAGLEAARTEWVAVLACDMPRAGAGVLRELLARAAKDDLDACLLGIERGTQPMLAVYRASCAPAVRRALERGERRMVSFLDGTVAESGGARRLRVAALPAGEIGAGEAALNLNTPEELAAELSRAAGGAR
jgi:molybdopterin-guanine dinucleotide biosynthesis protein A